MVNTSSPIANVVILGGNGAMGSLLCTRLADITTQVIAVDLQYETIHTAENIHYIQSDVCTLNNQAQNALSTADLVIATLPATVLSLAWPEIIACQKGTSLFVDTLSVKTPFINAVSQSKSPTEIISINPMFAPSLDFAGQSAVVIDIRRGPIANAFITLLESWGCNLVSLTAEEHDRYAAILQTLTHAMIITFGKALHKLNYDLKSLEPIIPPPHRTLLALVARILNADPEVYWDIQSSNPYAAEARNAFEYSAREFSKLIENQSQAEFDKLLNSISTLFDPAQLEKYQQACSELFNHYSTIKK